jgi:hypothetical protein
MSSTIPTPEAAARVRAYLDACPDANDFGREIRWELRGGDGQPYNLPRADLVAVLDGLDSDGAYLAAARHRHRAYPSPESSNAYCLSCVTGEKEVGSNFSEYVKWPCPEAVDLGMGKEAAK